MKSDIAPVSIERFVGLAMVLALHSVVLWGLWQYRILPSARETMTLFVEFIAPPIPKPSVKPPSPAKPVVKPKNEPRPAPRLVAQAPILTPNEPISSPPAPQPTPRIEAPALPPAPPAPPAHATPLPSGPIALGSELSVVCPERTAPAYPAISRRLGEEGTVVLHVELDQTGAVVHASVKSSSGFARLDEAALAAVRNWRCQPAQRNGQPVRATALQPFKFVLQ